MNRTTSNSQIVYIGLGSNLANPAKQIISARGTINTLNAVKELAFSSLYQSSPMGPQDQPDFINAVMAIATEIPAIELLHSLQSIETEQGRVRKESRWGARTLDLDILLCGDQIIAEPDLCVPHYGIAERAFVLYPLQEIAPELIIPGLGSVADLVAACPLDGIVRIRS